VTAYSFAYLLATATHDVTCIADLNVQTWPGKLSKLAVSMYSAMNLLFLSKFIIMPNLPCII